MSEAIPEILRARRGASCTDIVPDSWTSIRGDEFARPGDVIVDLPRWRRDSRALAVHDGRVGVRVSADTDIDELGEVLEVVDLVALEFAKFTDGRPYSLARKIREREGYEGPLRAVGDVLPDQLLYMRRCGFDEFALKAGKSLQTGLRCLGAFSESYQGAADDPRPLFRRRLAARAAAS